jgi:hypothetical protein
MKDDFSGKSIEFQRNFIQSIDPQLKKPLAEPRLSVMDVSFRGFSYLQHRNLDISKQLINNETARNVKVSLLNVFISEHDTSNQCMPRLQAVAVALNIDGMN